MLLHSAVEAFQIGLEYLVPADVFQLEVLQWKEALARTFGLLSPSTSKTLWIGRQHSDPVLLLAGLIWMLVDSLFQEIP